jgi:hypothetical protein
MCEYDMTEDQVQSVKIAFNYLLSFYEVHKDKDSAKLVHDVDELKENFENIICIAKAEL